MSRSVSPGVAAEWRDAYETAREWAGVDRAIAVAFAAVGGEVVPLADGREVYVLAGEESPAAGGSCSERLAVAQAFLGELDAEAVAQAQAMQRRAKARARARGRSEVLRSLGMRRTRYGWE